VATASCNDAPLLETEIAAAFWCRGANDDVINQLKLENFTGFDGFSGERISAGRESQKTGSFWVGYTGLEKSARFQDKVERGS